MPNPAKIILLLWDTEVLCGYLQWYQFWHCWLFIEILLKMAELLRNYSWQNGKISINAIFNRTVKSEYNVIRKNIMDSETRMQIDLKGKVALVTGASRGLGTYYAKILSDNGAHVIVTGRANAEEQLNKVVKEIVSNGNK